MELLEITIPEALARTAARLPDHIALVSRHQGIRLTWQQLAAQVEQVARGFTGLCLGPGDRIGMWSSNCAQWVLVQLACARIGAVLVNVNPAYRSHELRYAIERSKMKLLVLRDFDARASYRSILEQALESATAAPQHTIFLDDPSWQAMLDGGRAVLPFTASNHDVVNIQYTSGTTGSPKGVMLTHRNLINNAWLIGECLRSTEADVLVMPVPMYHCFGCVMASLQCVLRGVTLVMPAAAFDALSTIEAIHQERATILFGVPTMFIAQLDHPEFSNFDFSSLRTGIMAGASCPIEVMRKVVDLMHCPEMTIAYGQTEASPVITMSRADDSLNLRVTTVGCAMPHTEVQIVDGELCTRGYLVMKGYDQDPDATARAIDANGWLHTGDLATVREDGYYRITGRLKDMVIRGGENIYPREIEEFFFTNPKVADVQVFGVPDVKFGEALSAWIKLRASESATEEEMREFCRTRISYFKVPAYIRFVDSFPMTVTGKIQKFKMREMEIESRNLVAAAAIETA